MSTIPIRCPSCGEIIRVSVQPSSILKTRNALYVTFDEQKAAHACKEKK